MSAKIRQLIPNVKFYDPNWEWAMYVGPVLKGSRPFCKALIKRKYIHRTELKYIIKGNFVEFVMAGGKINPNTGLPRGMYADTTEDNFIDKCGGYGCIHQFHPVSDAAVPIEIRMKIPAALKSHQSLIIDARAWLEYLRKQRNEPQQP